jgi:glutamate synthase (NADPH/NADH) small chain
MTKEFIGDGKGNLSGLKTVEIKLNNNNQIEEIKGSEKIWPAQMVLLALGFLGPEKSLAEKFKLKLDERGNIKTDNLFQSSKNKIFAAGDARRGQSLIVWAISEGRDSAFEVDKFLMGKTVLTKKNRKGDLISA